MKRTYFLFAAALLLPTVARALNGEGTADAPYLLSTASDWAEMAAMSNATDTPDNFKDKHIALAGDIDFTGTEFVSVGSFAGTLDGNGHTLKGIDFNANTPYSGLFAVVEAEGTVRDLRLEGKTTCADQMNGNKVAVAANYFGGLTGKLYGTLEKCVNAMTVVSTSSKGYVGGLVGQAYNGARMVSCTNAGRVQGISGTSAGRVGGIAAAAEAGVEFSDCSNEGTIAMTGTSAAIYAAGIAAEAYPSTFRNCSNRGMFEFEKSDMTSCVAGILGYARSSSSNAADFVFENCFNEGDITAKGIIAGILAKADRYAAQIYTSCYNLADISVNAAAKASGSTAAGISSYGSAGSRFVNCYNKGNINGNLTPKVAGIMSYTTGTANAERPIVIDGCYNEGEIFAAGGYGGGIVADAPTYTYITNCRNMAPISGSSDLGGIAGALSGKDAYILNCFNIANVTGTAKELGGITGKINGKDAYVKQSWNGGAVSSSSTDTGNQGGYAIGGIAGLCCYTIESCYNLGEVSGANCVGGIIGDPGNFGSMKISDSYNAAPVKALTESCGSISGSALDPEDYPDITVAIADCYYNSDFGALPLNTEGYGKAATTAEMTSESFKTGETWSHIGEYCYPVIAGDESEAAALYAAAIVLTDEDTPALVTRDFKIGAPEGLTWTSDCDALTVTANDAVFSAPFTGEINLIGSIGSLSRVLTVNADVKSVSGLGAVSGEAQTVSTRYVDMSGRNVSAPADGTPVLRIRTMSDGSVNVDKLWVK